METLDGITPKYVENHWQDATKIAITFPVIRNFHVDVKKIAKKVGMKIVFDPIKESRKDQFISRDIVVFV